MNGAPDFMLQLEEVQTQGERDVHLSGPVERGDTLEKPLYCLRNARVLALAHLIPYVLALLVNLMLGEHARGLDRFFLVHLFVLRRDSATGRGQGRDCLRGLQIGPSAASGEVT